MKVDHKLLMTRQYSSTWRKLNMASVLRIWLLSAKARSIT